MKYQIISQLKFRKIKTQILNKVTAIIILAVFMLIATNAMAQRARAYERPNDRALEQASQRQQ